MNWQSSSSSSAPPLWPLPPLTWENIVSSITATTTTNDVEAPTPSLGESDSNNCGGGDKQEEKEKDSTSKKEEVSPKANNEDNDNDDTDTSSSSSTTTECEDESPVLISPEEHMTDRDSSQVLGLQEWAELVASRLGHGSDDDNTQQDMMVSKEQIERVKVMHDRFLRDASFSFNYNTLMLVASIIASLGLVSNSSASIIASMLVSPLMGK